MHILFDLDYKIGAIIGGIIVVLYCFSGGIRASIWTDIAQSFVMIIAMCLMVIFGIKELGGISNFLNSLQNISPNYMKWFPSSNFSDYLFAPFLFIMGWVFSGIGVIGQPHVMIRFMAINNTDNIPKHLPSLILAQKVQKKYSKLNNESSTINSLSNMRNIMNNHKTLDSDKVGEILFELSNYARLNKIDSEKSLKKFINDYMDQTNEN